MPIKALILWLVLGSFEGLSAPIKIGEESSFGYISRADISFFQEFGTPLSFSEVTAPSFKNKFKEGVGALGSSFQCPGSHWFKFEYLNPYGWERIKLRGNYSMKQIDFYSLAHGYLGTAGDRPTLGPKQWRLDTQEVQIPLVKGLNSVYIRVQCEIFLSAIFQSSTKGTNINYVFFRDYLVVVFATIVFLVGGFTFWVGMVGRSPIFLSYAGYVFSASLVAFSYLWVLPIIFDNLVISSLHVTLFGSVGVTASLTLFFYYLFKLYRFSTFRVLIKVLMIWNGILLIITIVKPYVLIILATQTLLMALAACLIIWQLCRKNPIAILFFVSGLPFFFLAQYSIGYVLGLTGASVFQAYLLPNAFLYETLTFSILLGFHYFIERRESEKLEKEVQQNDLKFAFQGMTNPNFPELSPQNKSRLEEFINQKDHTWIFAYESKTRLFCAYADINQISLRDMLACTYLSGILRSHIFFNRHLSSEDLLENMKVMIKRFYRSDPAQAKFDAIVLPIKSG